MMLSSLLRWTAFVALPGLYFASLSLQSAEAEEVTFLRDVRAVLAKGGCNAGTCHGNQNGKGGFKLSLRGEDPGGDYRVLARDLLGRRIEPLAPDESLILQKATLQVAHQGGQRFPVDSLEYRLLREWIAAGAPPPAKNEPRVVQLKVTPPEAVLVDPIAQVKLAVSATLSDGTERDVTTLAVYEPTNLNAVARADGTVERQQFGEAPVLVRFLEQQVVVPLAFVPARPEALPVAPPGRNFIDRHVDAKLARLGLAAADEATDGVFLRRVYLDLLGLIPTADEARAFLEDPRDDKRARLVDALLARPEFAEYWALKWSDLLRAEEKVLDAEGVTKFHAWIRDSLAANKPVDLFVRELLAARGSTYANPPANYYRALREPFVRGETTARLFLGARLQCAKCHNHPFDRWSQDDYYSWAAVFARIDYKIVDNKRTDKLDSHEFVGEQIVLVTDKGEVQNARTGKSARPQFLAVGERASVPEGDRLTHLAAWLTAAENRQFAQVQANWIWYHLLGRGIVEPVDDFRPTNPPINPALLDALADDFIAHGFDLKHLVRTIVASRTYQAAAAANPPTSAAAMNFAQALPRRLTAEQLLDSQSRALDAPATFHGYPLGIRAAQVAGVRRASRRERGGEGDRFLKTFGRPDRLLSCECERSNETTLKQAFTLVSGDGLHDRLGAAQGRLAHLAGSDRATSEIVTELLWATLSRPPSERELAAYVAYLDGHDRRAALEDLAWAIVTSSEFMFRP